MTVPKKQVLEIGAAQLAALIKPVEPAVGGDDSIPILTCVHFEIRNGWLLAMATDRFRLAVKRTKTDAKSFTANVRLKDLRTILRIFKPSRGRLADETNMLRLEVEKGELTVSRVDGFGWSLGFIDATLRFTLEDHVAYPDVLHIIGSEISGPRETDGWFGANASYLGDWKAAVERHQPLVCRIGKPGRPIIVTAGDDFVGALMPLRVSGSDGAPDDLAGWRELIGPSGPAPRKKTTAKQAPAKTAKRAAAKKATKP